MSDCRSIGSNRYRSSQSRKISIGVMVDSVGNKRSRSTKEDKATVASAERMNLNVDTSAEIKKKGQEVTAPVKGKQTDTPEQENSPWITPRSLYPQAPFPESVLHLEQPVTSGQQNNLNGQSSEPATYSVQLFVNKASILESGDGNQKKFDGFTYKRKGVKDRTTERVEEFAFATAQQVHVSDQVVIEDKADKTRNRTGILRMKLWEILGNVSSPKNENSNFQRPEVGTNNMKLGQNFDQNAVTVARCRQNSDTIETDSEASDHASRRPVTRSLTRKRVRQKVQVNGTKCGPSSGYIHKHHEKNFSLEGGLGRVNGAINGDSSKPMRKKIEKKSKRIEPRKILFPKKDVMDQIQEASYRSEAKVPAERKFSRGNQMEDIYGCIYEDEREYLGLENKIQEILHQSPLIDKTNLQGDFNSPVNQQDVASPSLNNDVQLQDNFQSPIFGFKTPISSSNPTAAPKTDRAVDDSHTSTPKMDQLLPGVHNPAPAERIFSVGHIRGFSTLQTSKSDCHGSITQAYFFVQLFRGYSIAFVLFAKLEHCFCILYFLIVLQGDTEVLTPPPEPAADTEERDTEDDLSETSAEERDYESSEEGSPIIEAYTGCRDRDILSSELVAAKQKKFMLHSTKRLQIRESIRFDNSSPTSPSPKGTGESNWMQEPSDQSQDDGLMRAIKLFALEIQKLQSKIESETTKKSSEILMSTSDGIYLQLQNLGSHIQTDVGKFTSMSKSRRKGFEVKLEEQHKELKLIHEKFKEDINRHFQDYRTTLEGLEAHHLELKGTMEKQKASHRKLLLQVEEGVEAQLNHAQRRITAIHELARGKMLQLKHVVSMCLKEGILS
ncbi:meiosis-specific protein ASY3 isoform X2 [Juglans microcarpa x Juglans regia]|nr:meiosis-specific protein ASY3 isoform X2 [Juglans microcarpa x Juglans regia]